MRRLGVLVTFVVLMATTASAQQVPVKDVRSVLEASMKAMGGTNLNTIQYSARGWNSRVGQTYTLNEDWPKYEVIDYSRVIDYDAGWSREERRMLLEEGTQPTGTHSCLRTCPDHCIAKLTIEICCLLYALLMGQVNLVETDDWTNLG